MTARLPLRFGVYAPSGAQMLATLRPTSYQLQLVASRATQSALTISVRAADEAAQLLTSPCEIGVQVANRSGVWSDVPNGRFCVMSAALDRTTGSSAILTATTLSLAAYRLGGVLFVPSTSKTPQTLTGTPGAIWHTLVSEAQGRGLLTGLSVDTSATVDGTGIAWSAGSKSLKLDAGTSYADILDMLINNAWCDATFSDLSMSMVNHVAPSASQPTAFLHVGRAGGLATAPTTTDWSGLATGAVVVGSDGATVAHAASTALTSTAWDGYETLVNSSTTSTPSALQTAGTQYLGTRSTESLTSTADLTLDPSGPLPLLDYALGDYVSVLSTGDTRRVEQLDVSAGSGSGLTGTVTFNARSVSVGRSLAKQVARVSAGARILSSADVALDPRQVIHVAPQGRTTTPVVDVRNFGAQVDGTTDDTSAITAALAAASPGGTVSLPSGTLVHSGFRIPSGVRLVGQGSHATTLKLANGANTIGVSNAAMATFDTALAQPAPSLTTATTGGTLAAGTYAYRVAAARYNVPGANGSNGTGDPIGETLASAEVSITTTGSTSTVTVSWAAVTGATGYVVYGRTSGAEQRMAVVTGTTWTDNGSITPAGLVQDVDASYSRASTQDTGIVISGLTIDGNRTNQTTGGQFSAAYFNNVDQLTVRDVRVIAGTKHNLELHFVSNSAISQVTCTGAGLTGLMCYRGVHGNAFTAIVSSNNGVYAGGTGLLFDHGCSGNSIAGLVAQYNSLDGLDISEGASFNVASGVNCCYNTGAGVSISDGQTGRVTTGNKVEGVTSWNSGQGCYSSGGTNSTFNLTSHHNGASGMQITAGAAQAGTGNTVTANAQDNTNYGVDIRQDRNTVAGGDCSHNGVYGVLIINASNCAVRGTQVWDTNLSGSTTNSGGVVLDGTGANNVVEGCTVANQVATAGHKYGVWIKSTSQSYSRIRNNRVFNAKTANIPDNGTGTVFFGNDTAATSGATLVFASSVASTANLNLTTTATAVPGAALTLPASTGSFLVTGVMDLGSGSAGYGVGQLYVAGVAQASQVIVEYTAGRATQSQTWIIPGTTGTQTLALYCSATSGTGWVCGSPHTTITAVEIK